MELTRAAAGDAASRPSVREEQKQLTRRRIVAAATEIFERSGYTEASVATIAQAAGINRATFYLHFTTKADVLGGVVEEFMRDSAPPYWASLDEALASGSGARVRDWLGQARGWWSANARLLAAWREAAVVDPAIAHRANGIAQIGADMLAGFLAGMADERRVEALRRVRLLLSQLDHVWGSALFDGEDPERLFDSMAAIWCAALGLDDHIAPRP
ncbi:TetR/AcrR family transcriptional regulator [Nocardia sp. CA-136227]|uniref:TetR/AcrR family transcriptional regulator n=1 Tax=Nocardia sp. CA-136227 TaxID=3239979 RepID=UPI003D9A095E